MPEERSAQRADRPRDDRVRDRGAGESRGAAANRGAAGGDAGAAPDARNGGIAPAADKVLVQVCLTCGTERIFDASPPPSGMQCAKCGSRVFRTFYDVPGRDDDVHEDFLAATERDLAPDDAESDVSVDDILDLNNP